MRKYVKPIAVVNSNLAEGVYAASGDECFDVTAYIHQSPQEGRGDYRIQVNAYHGATDGHHSGAQILTLSFNQAVEFVDAANGTLNGGDNTSQLSISYKYHGNPSETVGLGDVVVRANAGLAVTGATLSCNHNCGQH